jgi:hypothetical protein
MNVVRSLVICVAAHSLVTLPALGASDLSRREAASQLEAKLKADVQMTDVPLGDRNGIRHVDCGMEPCRPNIFLTHGSTPAEYPILKERGLLDYKLVEKFGQPGATLQLPTYWQRYQVFITDAGKKFVLADGVVGSDRVGRVKLADFVNVEITGMTAPATDAAGVRVSYANFEAKYRATPFGDAMPDRTATVSQGQAKFVLFDDGWRLGTLRNEAVAHPPPAVARPISAAAAPSPAIAAPPEVTVTPQQEKMKACIAKAGDKKGDDRKAFMTDCLHSK